jgi:hypothetical protein
VILYRKVPQLRMRRVTAPEPPFWAATSLSPYGPKRATPFAIDYLALRASGVEKAEVTVCEDVRDELDRARGLEAPLLIDAAGQAEVVFQRGEQARLWCEEHDLEWMLLTTVAHYATVMTRTHWGVVVPVMYPVTTELPLLAEVADRALDNGASFFAAASIDADPTARQAIAQSMNLAADDDRYAMLFHAPAEPIQLATERHIAALAWERGLADFVVPPQWDERTNWNASVLLTLIASRMMALELDLDLAGLIARSARTVAELDKPLARIAAAASLSIINGVDDTSVELLTEWIAGETPGFVEYVNEQWRLKRTLNDEG